MSVEDAVGLVIAVIVLGYLVFALIYPERLG
jgi:K+-transporting ATPase KdpF subunit